MPSYSFVLSLLYIKLKKISIFFLINLLKFDIIECRLKYNGDMFDFNTIC